ncbi:MAG: hypothetical protein EPO51_08310 [Phenylobacterium sp.]|uniref:PIN-like domain-containing protein n=1 Tax=Phenylobacterium sp. TaxID=1871053 RepID=UPI0011F724C1|nr:PIN-like domain-containing protein [Phenylobacterium sp.]TAJ72112.1 MAG: hypothetical protein EPO51_08310 [Phenylobacterium sp.]
MFQNRLTSRAAFVADLKAVVDGSETYFFADTSFLIAVGSLHPAARKEVCDWLKGLGKRFRVPAWVAHELFGKISKDTPPLVPMVRSADAFVSALALLQSESRRFLDDGRAAGFNQPGAQGPQDRVGFLAALDREIVTIRQRAQHLKKAASQSLEETTEVLVELLNGRVLDSDIYADLRDVQAIHAVRLEGGLPPGIADRKKDDNRYGDLIIWLEVVRGCKDVPANAIVLLSNDVKPDWAFTPPNVRNDAGKAASNLLTDGFKVIFPQPLLVHELQQSRAGATLSLVTLPTLAVLLHRELGGGFPNLFSAYTAAAQADAPAEGTEGPPEEVPEGQELPREPERQAPIAVAEIVRLLGSLDPTEAAAGVAAVRSRLEAEAPLDEPRTLGRLLVEAVAVGLEPASILVRDIIGRNLGRGEAVDLVSGMYGGTYFDTNGEPRDMPLAGAIDDLFAVQTVEAFRPALLGLQARLAGRERSFLLLPDWNEPRVRLELATEASASRGRRLVAILNGEASLTQDVLPGDARSLRALIGSDAATVDEVRNALAAYFRVPARQIETNLIRSERVEFDEIIGLTRWGPNTDFRLR